MGDYELYHADRKKHKYIKKIGKRYFYTQQEIAAYLKEKKGDVTFEKNIREDQDGKVKDYRIDFNKHDGGHNGGGWSDGIGVRVGNKKVSVYNTTNQKYMKNPDVKNDRKGRLKTEYAEDGVTRTLDYSDSKTFRSREKRRLKQDRANVEWLKSMGVDVSKDEADLKRDEAEFNKKEKKRSARAKTLKSLKKQSAKGKKALKKFYKNNINPGVTVTYDEAKIK